MAINDLSAKQLEKLATRLEKTSQAYKESGLYPPPQIISELRRAKQLLEKKKIPPKPDVEHQAEITTTHLNHFQSHFCDYMDGKIIPETFIDRIGDLANVLKDMQNQVKLLEDWKTRYEGRTE